MFSKFKGLKGQGGDAPNLLLPKFFPKRYIRGRETFMARVGKFPLGHFGGRSPSFKEGPAQKVLPIFWGPFLRKGEDSLFGEENLHNFSRCLQGGLGDKGGYSGVFSAPPLCFFEGGTLPRFLGVFAREFSPAC